MAYSEEEIIKSKETIIQGICDGKSLVKIIESDSSLPSIRTVFNWINPDSDYHDSEFLHNYTLATQIRSEREFEEILLIADDQENDVYKDSNDIEQVNHNVINRARIRIDARKWRLGKMQPKKYGDFRQVDLNLDDKRLTPEERSKKIEELKSKLGSD
jgi:hypothetical protein